MTPLIFSAALYSRVRLGEDSNNLATTVAGVNRRWEHLTVHCAESLVVPTAKALGKGWRFFATYAERQTGPVLRQPFSLPCLDHEC
jgi:hypothetical protein